MSDDANKFMDRALELAGKGLGKVSPNPMVGCVIVHNGKIIGEGYHEKYGEAHAEVNAIHSVSDQSILKESELFVTLEPCSHFGKTAPCADLIIKHQIPKVTICNIDPNPKVAGNGIKKLEDAGIIVDVGIKSNEGEKLNKRFFKSMRDGSPLVILKWAQTKDGFIARLNNDSKWISNESSRALVHQWRAEEDAIMVGTKTAQFDNPRLNIRVGTGKDPLRVVVDRFLKLSNELNLFDDSQPTIVYNTIEDKELGENLKYVKLNTSNSVPKQILSDLNNRNIHSVIIEGGTTLINSFLKENLVDEIRVFKSEISFTEGILAPVINNSAFIKISENKIDDDLLEIYSIRKK